MVVKVDKSKEFVKSGKILVSEYPAIHPKSIKTKKSEWKLWKMLIWANIY